jgi:serine/threonine protein kinase, bacterial
VADSTRSEKKGGHVSVRNGSIGLAVALLVAACGGSNDSSNQAGSTTGSPTAPVSGPSGNGTGTSTVTVGGSVSGLTTSGLMLKDNGADELSIASGATTFKFATALNSGSSYAVTFSGYPAGLYCSLANQGGTASTDITSVSVACSDWSEATAQVGTLAGSTTFGSTNGTGSAASFNWPYAVAADASGNVYVADRDNNLIRKVTPDGVVTTLAGSGTSGSSDGTGTAASFNSPYGIAVDASGYVYVADYSNNEIRKISPAGAVTTLAGSTTAGAADGTGAAASFSSPFGIAVDANGNVYVGDQGNSSIRKITAAGVVSTLAGGTSGYAEGTGSAAKFNQIAHVAVDANGNVYVADQSNNRIRMVTPAGVTSTFAGNGTASFVDGPATSAEFSAPIGVAVDSAGNVYVGDKGNNRVRMITPAGVVSTLAGNGVAGATNSTGASSEFSQPFGVAVVRGNIAVADRSNNEIRLIGRTP